MTMLAKPAWTWTWTWMNAERFEPDRVLETLNISEPPVDVFAIAQRLGVMLAEASSEEWDGVVESDTDGRAVIYVRSDQALTRQRFTVAHELGHLLLHEPGRRFRDSWSSTGVDLAEVQANNFAAALLMPS